MYNKLYFDKENLPKVSQKTEFGNRLRKLRKEKKESQEYVSEQLGYAKGTYGTYENSRYIPDADTMAQLADYFNVSADYLLGLTDCPETARNDNLFSVNFSSTTRDRLLDIAKNKVLTEVFELLIANPKFEELLFYINTYLIFSQRLDTGSTSEMQEAFKRATHIDISKNEYLSPEAYPDGGVKVSDIYMALINQNLTKIINDMSKENKKEYKKEITRIAQEEESKSRENY